MWFWFINIYDWRRKISFIRSSSSPYYLSSNILSMMILCHNGTTISKYSDIWEKYKAYLSKAILVADCSAANIRYIWCQTHAWPEPLVNKAYVTFTLMIPVAYLARANVVQLLSCPDNLMNFKKCKTIFFHWNPFRAIPLNTVRHRNRLEIWRNQ